MNYPDELMFIKNRNAKQRESHYTLRKKTILISGANSGIGRETAIRCAQDGAHLILLARDPEKAEQLKTELDSTYKNQNDIYIADYLKLKSVLGVCKRIVNDIKKIDIIIHNAGIHSTHRFLSEDGFEYSFQVNYLAHYLMTMKLLPLLKKSETPQILFINSEGHRFSAFDLNDYNFNKRHYTGLRAYGASKTAQLLTVLALKNDEVFKRITIFAMHPGDVKSNIGQNNGWIYRLFSHFFIQPFLRDPKSSAKAIHTLISDPIYKQINGQFYHLTILEKPANHACDLTLAIQVVQLSNKLLEAYL